MADQGIVIHYAFPQSSPTGRRDGTAQLHSLDTARVMRRLNRTVMGGLDAMQQANARNIAVFCDAVFEGAVAWATFWVQVAFPYGNTYQQAKMGQVIRTLQGLQYD